MPWPFFKVKMLSYLAQKGLIELLSYKGDIDTDDKTYTNDEKKTAAVKTAITLKYQNRKAAGVLLSCIWQICLEGIAMAAKRVRLGIMVIFPYTTLFRSTWDGKKKTWPFFKVKMLSYLAQKGLIELLSYKVKPAFTRQFWVVIDNFHE